MDPKEINFETNRAKFLAYLSNPQNWNKYNYVLNNPLALTDPNGEEPNKSQAGTAQQVVAIIQQIERNNPGASPSQILTKVNDYLSSRRDTAGDSRYVYTESNGWIDTKHFFAAADSAANTYAMEAGTIVLGVGVEVWQSIKGTENAWSYEDLPSNAAGAEFGDEYFSPNGAPLSEQVGNFFSKELKDRLPQAAPNYTKLPAGPTAVDQTRSAQALGSRTPSTQSGRANSRSARRNTQSVTDRDKSAGKAYRPHNRRRTDSSQ